MDCLGESFVNEEIRASLDGCCLDVVERAFGYLKKRKRGELWVRRKNHERIRNLQ